MDMGRPNRIGFLAALFDFSFSPFVIPKIADLAYIIVLAVSGLAFLVAALRVFQISFVAGLLALVACAVGFLLNAMASRIAIEAAVALVRTAQNTTELLRK
jgi:hypothetical protein